MFLTGELAIEVRTRYNFWDLLGDVGGLHDGLTALTGLFMGFIAKEAFNYEYLNGKISENPVGRASR